MGGDGLPHVYPFRFVDTVLRQRNADFPEGTVRVRVSADDRAAMGEGWASPALFAEAIAQAALLLEGGDPEIGRRGLLAGIEGFEVKREPRAGETLEIDVRLSSRFGPILKFEGKVRAAEGTIAHGGILVRRGQGPAA